MSAALAQLNAAFAQGGQSATDGTNAGAEAKPGQTGSVPHMKI